MTAIYPNDTKNTALKNCNTTITQSIIQLKKHINKNLPEILTKQLSQPTLRYLNELLSIL